MREVEIEEVVRNLKLTVGILRTEKPETAESILNLIRGTRARARISYYENMLIRKNAIPSDIARLEIVVKI